MDISNIFLLYDGDGSPESPFLVSAVGFAEALVPVVGLAGASVVLVIIVEPVVFGGPSVGGIKQLQIKNNNNNIIKDEVVQKLNKPDSNYTRVMAPVTRQPCIIINFILVNGNKGSVNTVKNWLSFKFTTE